MSLLLHATSLYPTLPIFPASISSGASAAPHAQIPNSQAQVSHSQAQVFNSSAQPVVAEEEETYDILYPSSGALPYPKAGNGVPLPREKVDLAFLIDDDAVTFSHVWDWDGNKLFGVNEQKKEVIIGGLGPVDRSIGVGA